MRVLFRVDSSIVIGAGHVRRCLTLADALQASGAYCWFVTREKAGDMIETIAARGYPFFSLPSWNDTESAPREQVEPKLEHASWLSVSQERDAEQTLDAIGDSFFDWLVVDHYALDYRWQTKLRSVCEKLMVIDDLADRKHDCDLLLDQNLGARKDDYLPLTPTHCQLMMGVKYALLRPEFHELRGYSLGRRDRQNGIGRLIISMGGFDSGNMTGQILEALALLELPEFTTITVVMGGSAPWLETVREQARRMPVPTKVLVDIDDMAQQFAEADLAIGAAGATSWERCCLGLPTILCVLADNQVPIADALCAVGAVLLISKLDLNGGVSVGLKQVYNDPMLLHRMSVSAASVTDGLGAQRLINSSFDVRLSG